MQQFVRVPQGNAAIPGLVNNAGFWIFALSNIFLMRFYTFG
jgi:hypothetical protein